MAFLTQKYGLKDKCSETLLIFMPIKLNIFRQKNQFNVKSCLVCDFDIDNPYFEKKGKMLRGKNISGIDKTKYHA